MSELTVAACSIDAARYAVENWHYSQILPAGKIVKFGVWEGGLFIGCVLFSRGASPFLGKSLDLDTTEVCELVRVALTKHVAPVSQIVALSIKMLKVSNPLMRAIVSFADPKEGHKGGIYQAGNWTFTGSSSPTSEFFIGGRWRHVRGAWAHPERPTAPHRIVPGKFRYVYPLDKVMRRTLNKLTLDYPHAIEGLEESRSDSVTEVQVRSLGIALKDKP